MCTGSCKRSQGSPRDARLNANSIPRLERRPVNRAQSGVAGGSAARGYFLAAAVLLAATPLSAGEPERAAPPAAWRGDWSIIRDLGAPGISALSDDVARRLIGSAIVLGAGSAKFGNDACSAVTYRLAEQTTDDFLLGFRITRAQLP